MAKPTTRQEFKEYCLRKLGAPVIQINMSDEQIEDRIDQAISFWNDYFYDGSEQVYLRHQLTQQDIDNGYIEAPDELLGVTRIFELFSSLSTGSGMFNIVYQFVLNNIQDLTGYSIQNYYMTMQNLRFLQEWLVGMPMIRYNRHSNRIHLDMTKSRLTAGGYVIIEGYAAVNGADMWSDRWLQNYATVLIKENWASNLTKFTNMQLVGGVMFNAERLADEAREERIRLETDAIENLQPMTYSFSG